MGCSNSVSAEETMKRASQNLTTCQVQPLIILKSTPAPQQISPPNISKPVSALKLELPVSVLKIDFGVSHEQFSPESQQISDKEIPAVKINFRPSLSQAGLLGEDLNAGQLSPSISKASSRLSMRKPKLSPIKVEPDVPVLASKSLYENPHTKVPGNQNDIRFVPECDKKLAKINSAGLGRKQQISGKSEKKVRVP